MGDFNCDASCKDFGGGINVLFPEGATHQGGKILDFALVSDALISSTEIVVRRCCDTSGYVPLSSDHFPIYCEF